MTQRATTAAPGPGSTLSGRYRLNSPLGGAGALRTWRAHDQALARDVVVRVGYGLSAAESEQFLRAAADSGRVVHPAVAPTYDADIDAAHDAVFLVREWVEGTPLPELLRSTPLEPDRAAAIGRDVARALAALHGQGGAHGCVHPANVIVSPQGQAVLTDGVVGRPAELGSAATTDQALAAKRDLMAAGSVVYAALTRCWPAGERDGLSAAPDRDGQLAAPRQVRGGVPRALDAVVMRTLGVGDRGAAVPSCAALAGELQEMARDLDPGPVDAPGVVGPTPLPRSARLGALAAGLIAVGVAGWLLGTSIGKVPGQSRGLAIVHPAASAGTGATGTTIPVVAIRDFDPPPGDGAEGTASVPLAVDGDASSAWQTDTYTSAALGGIKAGVGVVLDLGSAQQVRSVELTLPTAGEAVELRSADTASTALADFALESKAAATSATTDTLATTSGRPHRYWLVWLTSLPKVAGGYRGGLSEVVVRS